tara:strand:- start:388 stop:579 length:192 start_codon:yes stop_codon:yes gene_type:complete
MAKKDKKEVVEEILDEVPEAEVVSERELPEDTGEETSETRVNPVTGRMQRVIKTSTGTKYQNI